MTNSQKLSVRLSEIRQRLNEVAGLEGDAFTDAIRLESDKLQAEFADKETQYRAAIVGEGEAEKRALETEPDAELRERRELRGRASLGAYLRAALSGRRVDGPERELQEASKVGEGIPLELWDTAQPEHRADVATGAPGTVGVNLDRIRPAVFAQSILPRLGVEMPRVESGTYASATITTSLTAGSKAKGAAAEASAAGFTVTSVTPKRISARMGIRIEDIAAVGQVNFEPILRENLSLVLSDALDSQGLNGAGAGADLVGIFQRLTDPAAPPAAVADFDAFAAAHAGGIEGLWALTLKDVAIVCGAASYGLASRTFQTAANYKGELSAAAYAERETGGLWTSKRMPDAAATIQQAILYRKGRSMMGGAGAMRTAVCPQWNEISIDDIFSGSASGERFFTMHVLLGDVILTQPAAYAQVAFKVST